MDALTIDLTVNGTQRRFAVAPNLVLADLLRDTCRLAGCKIGCDQAACGACTVLVDGQPVAACATFAFAIDGSAITTIEGLGRHEALHPVQEAFLDTRAFQCGFCTSGMIMSVTALLAEHPRPDRETIRDWLGGNICRCTGYATILAAVEAAAERLWGCPTIRASTPAGELPSPHGEEPPQEASRTTRAPDGTIEGRPRGSRRHCVSPHHEANEAFTSGKAAT